MWAYLLTMALVSNGDGGEEPRTPAYSREELIEELMLPKYVDPDHPRPAWVDALASKPRSSTVTEFKRLGKEQQIEFAVHAFRPTSPGFRVDVPSGRGW